MLTNAKQHVRPNKALGTSSILQPNLPGNSFPKKILIILGTSGLQTLICAQKQPSPPPPPDEFILTLQVSSLDKD